MFKSEDENLRARYFQPGQQGDKTIWDMRNAFLGTSKDFAEAMDEGPFPLGKEPALADYVIPWPGTEWLSVLPKDCLSHDVQCSQQWNSYNLSLLNIRI